MQEIFKHVEKDDIVSIEITDEEIDMIDISIDSKDMLFIANELITHNSAMVNNDPTMEQIAESAALIHTVDGLFGIIQDEIMYMNNEYFLKTLANREEGYKNSKKRFTVSYDYLRISEDLNSEIINPTF
jgi:hypothetical protein